MARETQLTTPLLTPLSTDLSAEQIYARVAELVAPGGYVALCSPVHPSITDAIVAAGARYVDAGRDHAFAVDHGGWLAVLTDARVCLAYLAERNWPTGTADVVAAGRAAQAAGIPLLTDQRFQNLDTHWVRRPGVPSAQIAADIADPRVVGSAEWTWRDAVLVRASDPELLATI
ncbi:MAG: hypothetical protein ACI9WU_004082 [Myxococcota bacterium]|jgi:hypothetical protein